MRFIPLKSLTKFILGFFIFSLFFLGFNLPAQASWVKMNNSNGHDLVYNTNNDLASLTQQSMAVDSNGNPYIVWVYSLVDSDDNQIEMDIYFSKWTPSACSGSGCWTKMDGTLGHDNISGSSHFFQNPIIKLDSNDNPYVIWQLWGSGDVYFTKWTPGIGWTKIDNTLGSDDFSISSFEVYFLNLELSSNNIPFVSWSEKNSGISDIFISKGMAGSGWKKMNGTSGHENITDNGDIWPQSSAPILRVGSNNNPYLMWADELNSSWPTNREIMFTKWSGSAWTKMDGDSGFDHVTGPSGVNPGGYNDFQLDSNNRPYLAWAEDMTGPPTYAYDIYFTKWSGSDWTKMNGDLGQDNLSNNSGMSALPKIKINTSNIPYVAWQDETTGLVDIYFSKWTAGTGWTSMDGTTSGYDNVSDDVDASGTPDMIIDSSDNPEIAWLEADILLKKWTPGAGPGVCGGIINDCWTKMDGTAGYDNVSNTGAGSIFNMLKGASSYPYFAWAGWSIGGDIYFTKWGTFGLAPLTGQVTLSASVDPSLTFTLSSTACNLGAFDTANLKTCSYSTSVTTNASSGYTAYVRTDGNLRNATNSITNVSGGSVAVGAETYGVATTLASQSISRINDVNSDGYYTQDDCTALNNQGSTALTASALTISDQSFASSGGPVASDSTYLCHAVAITGATPAGAYSQLVTITVIGNF